MSNPHPTLQLAYRGFQSGGEYSGIPLDQYYLKYPDGTYGLKRNGERATYTRDGKDYDTTVKERFAIEQKDIGAETEIQGGQASTTGSLLAGSEQAAITAAITGLAAAGLAAGVAAEVIPLTTEATTTVAEGASLEGGGSGFLSDSAFQAAQTEGRVVPDFLSYASRAERVGELVRRPQTKAMMESVEELTQPAIRTSGTTAARTARQLSKAQKIALASSAALGVGSAVSSANVIRNMSTHSNRRPLASFQATSPPTEQPTAASTPQPIRKPPIRKPPIQTPMPVEAPPPGLSGMSDLQNNTGRNPNRLPEEVERFNRQTVFRGNRAP